MSSREIEGALTVIEKKNRHRHFVDKYFTSPTWAQLHLLKTAFRDNHSYIQAELNDILKLEDRQSIHSFRAMYSFMRLMTSIETLLAMTYVLSKRSLKSFAQAILRYDLNQVDRIVNGIQSGRMNDNYLVFGLPNPKNISVAPDDRQFLHNVFTEIARQYVEDLVIVAKFYHDHVGVYGKMKHGLMVHFTEVESPAGKIKAVMTWDRHDKVAMRGSCYRPPKNPSPPDVDWFNVVSLLPQDTGTLSRYISMAGLAFGLADEIIKNYSEFGSNCGRDYLPSGLESILKHRKDEGVMSRYLDLKKVLDQFFNRTRWKFEWKYTFSGDAAEFNLNKFKTGDVAVHWYPDRKEEDKIRKQTS